MSILFILNKGKEKHVNLESRNYFFKCIAKELFQNILKLFFSTMFFTFKLSKDFSDRKVNFDSQLTEVNLK